MLSVHAHHRVHERVHAMVGCPVLGHDTTLAASSTKPLQFMEFAKIICGELAAAGHWADYIDPCSGLPMVHRETGAVYGEVEALCTLRGYRTQNAGCCKIVLHPRWGSSVYPASMFARAPVEAVVAAIAVAEAALGGVNEAKE